MLSKLLFWFNYNPPPPRTDIRYGTEKNLNNCRAILTITIEHTKRLKV